MATGLGRRVLPLPLLLLVGGLSLVMPLRGQLVLGQYEDEAPLGSWNAGLSLAPPATAMGGLSFSRAWDGSSSLVNPALLAGLNGLSASFAAGVSSATLFKFALVNTGVVTSQGPLGVASPAIEQASVAYRRGDWALALAAAVTESFARPDISVGEQGASSAYQLTFGQSGYLRVLHVGVARRLPGGWAVGLGINAATGRLDRETVEQSVDLFRVVTITDEKRESLRGFFLNGGLTWDRGGRFAAGLAFRSPYRRKAAARSLFRYEVPGEGTDIRIDAEGTNIYRQPWVLGAGGSYRFSEHWSAIAGLAWIGWSGYEVELYGEPAERRFRDAVRAGAGIEFLVPARSRPRAVRVPLRLGISYDHQPMPDPRSAYLSITFGAGLKWLGLAVDLSASVGGERGSGSGLTSGRAVLGVRYALSR